MCLYVNTKFLLCWSMAWISTTHYALPHSEWTKYTVLFLAFKDSNTESPAVSLPACLECFLIQKIKILIGYLQLSVAVQLKLCTNFIKNSRKILRLVNENGKADLKFDTHNWATHPLIFREHWHCIVKSQCYTQQTAVKTQQSLWHQLCIHLQLEQSF